MSILLVVIGYVTAYYNVFSSLFELFIDVPFLLHTTKLFYIFMGLSIAYICLIFLPMEKIAEYDRQTSGTSTMKISATEQLKRRGSF